MYSCRPAEGSKTRARLTGAPKRRPRDCSHSHFSGCRKMSHGTAATATFRDAGKRGHGIAATATVTPQNFLAVSLQGGRTSEKSTPTPPWKHTKRERHARRALNFHIFRLLCSETPFHRKALSLQRCLKNWKTDSHATWQQEKSLRPMQRGSHFLF